jgi:superfamily II DNA or RNA helicase
VLYSHQQHELEANRSHWGLWHETGTGKSRTLIELIRKNKTGALLICPKSIKERWRREVNSNNLPYFVYVVTKEEFRRDHKILPKFNALVIDEAHAFSNPKSQLYKAALWWSRVHKPSFVWLATATPFRSTPWNAYALATLLGKSVPWRPFREAFFQERYLGRRAIWVPKDEEADQERLMRFFRSFGSVVRLEDCVDMPPAVFEYETITLTPSEKKAINALEEDNPIVRYAKVHQIENGTLKGNEFRPDVVFKNNNKIARLLDMAEGASKLAIFAKYNLQIRAIAGACQTAGYTVFELTGATENADEVIRLAEEAERAVIVINTDKSEGYELPSFKTVVYASLPWSLVSWTQSLGRFRRINKPQRVSYTVLVSDGEVDKAVQEALDKKTDFQLKLFCEERATVPKRLS